MVRPRLLLRSGEPNRDSITLPEQKNLAQKSGTVKLYEGMQRTGDSQNRHDAHTGVPGEIPQLPGRGLGTCRRKVFDCSLKLDQVLRVARLCFLGGSCR